MRGYLQPAIKPAVSDAQSRFTTLSRGRRAKLAETARTTLVKADQWARGRAVPADVASALEAAVGGLKQKKG
jgi:hypothetical protein